jgi:hypothetical protein
MEPLAQLWELYQQWKQLTEDEGAAIGKSDWTAVRRCQSAKKKLQPEIIRCTELAKGREVARKAVEAINAKIRETVNELIMLETRNSETLEKLLAAMKEEHGELHLTSKRLRQVRQSYVPKRPPAWNQYS